MNLVIDIGSSNITVVNAKFKGAILSEPSVLMATLKKNQLIPRAFGDEVTECIANGKVGGNIIYPIKDGVIINFQAVQLLVEYILSKLANKIRVKSKVRILVLVSAGLTAVERQQVEQIFTNLGFTNIFIIESLLATAKAIERPDSFIVDIGADKTEIGFVLNETLLCGASINIGGNVFNNNLIKYIKEKYHINIGKMMAEKVKTSLACINSQDRTTVKALGKDNEKNPRPVEISANDLRLAIGVEMCTLCDTIGKMLRMLPKDNLEAIVEHGIFLCGGSEKIEGIADFISTELDIKVNRLDSLSFPTVSGGASYAENNKELARLLKLEKI